MEIQYWCHNRKLKTEQQAKNETLPCVGDYVSWVVVDAEDKDLDKFEVFRVVKRYFVMEGNVVRLILSWSSQRMVCG